MKSVVDIGGQALRVSSRLDAATQILLVFRPRSSVRANAAFESCESRRRASAHPRRSRSPRARPTRSTPRSRATRARSSTTCAPPPGRLILARAPPHHDARRRRLRDHAPDADDADRRPTLTFRARVRYDADYGIEPGGDRPHELRAASCPGSQPGPGRPHVRLPRGPPLLEGLARLQARPPVRHRRRSAGGRSTAARSSVTTPVLREGRGLRRPRAARRAAARARRASRPTASGAATAPASSPSLYPAASSPPPSRPPSASRSSRRASPGSTGGSPTGASTTPGTPT